MRTLRILLGALVLTLMVSAQKPQEYILWEPDRKLSWSDFRARTVVVEDGVSALSHLVLYPTYSYDRTGVKYRVECRFIPERSWVSETGKRQELLLEHEQGHFDLAEYYARILRQALAKAELNPDNIRDRMSQLKDSVVQLDDARQALYDKETDLGRNDVAQRQWTAAISKDLASMAEYADL